MSRLEFGKPRLIKKMMIAKGENKVVEDVEEGEISDNASVEEISEADFNKREVNKEEELSLNSTSNSNSTTNPNSKSKPETTTTTTATRVWTFQELCKYQIKYQINKGYTAGLHNLAWAQAVQKKPLSEVLNLDFEDENNNNNSSRAAVASSSLCSLNNSKEESKLVGAVVIDDDDDGGVAGEKEEGELEEGEIDLDNTDSNAVPTMLHGEVKDDNFKVESMDVDDEKINLHDGELEKRVEWILEALKKIIQNISMISFEGACSQLLNSVDSIKVVELADDFRRKKDGVVQLFFSALQAVYSEYFSMNSIHRERNKGFFSRVLASAKSMDASLFSTNQMKEIEEMVQSLDSQLFMSDIKPCDDMESSVGVTGHNLISSQDLARDPVETLKQAPYSTRSKGILLPLLDLHKDHDEDDLPSPTREAPRLSFSQTLGISDGSFKLDLRSGRLSHVMEGIKLHPYGTEAVRAVSNYQQKFGRSMLSNDLPSPTPSEEHDSGVDDTGGEVTSSSKGKSVTMDLPNLVRPSLPPPLPQIEIANVQKVIAPVSAAPPALASNLPAKPSAKSRDPRLRFASPDSGNSDNSQRSAAVNNGSKVEAVSMLGTKMQRNVGEAAVDGPAVKRPRNGLENLGTVKDVRAPAGTGGWLGDNDMAGSQNTNRNHLQESLRDPRKMDNELASKPNAATSETDATLLSSLVSTASLPALLKNIAVNPTMLMNFLKLGQQQKLVPEAPHNHVDPSKNTSNPANGSSILGTAPAVSVAPAMAPGILPKSAGQNQFPAQTVQDEAGKIRMKPRDPRRILHSNPPPRSGSLGSEQLKNGSLTEVVPDIAQQFSKNLKDVADVISASHASTAPVVASQNLPSQSTQVSPVEAKVVVSGTKDQLAGSASTVEAGAAGLSDSQNSWGDVEHLFEGYDDQQRAAIQRERSRRIEEQKKMFAQRKLSLVLDLDHTLLNSAKFVEVDLVHEEILRKKEQEDKEKPQRHLFRFSHMGMWTKLRPGIWNFLEKASKLYELHLYTMGNKLYATEMAKVLDPKGTLFSGRVISRGDDGDPLDGDDRFKTKDLEGVLGMESGVVIIDDSVRVWPHNKLNLIVVERYTYFPCSRRQFGLLGPSLLEIDHDERTEEGTLASSLAVIEKIHQNFFSHQSLDDVDVRNILAGEQKKILAGCRIVFSRVFPVGEANPHLHPLWQTAEQFGAVCTNQIDEQVTHVVANSLGTDKVNWALSTGRFVVHPGWVEASALLYRRANEQDFAIKP